MNNTMMIRNPQTNEWEPVYLPPTGDTFPIGAYAFIAGEQTPTNWLRCDGQAVSRTEYADLFNVIGTTYGAGDGSTTFNLPNVNLENRTLVGSSGDGEFALGNTMGEKEVKLELENYIYGVYNNDDKNEKNDISMMFHPTGNSYGLGSVYVSNKNEPHNNMQPSIAAICIIKAKQSVGLVGSVTDDINDTNENAVANAKTIKNYVDEKNTYSTSEKVVGTWIDGKPIYRKVIDFGELPNAGFQNVAHNIKGLDSVICLRGIAKTTTNNFYPIPFVGNGAMFNNATATMRINATEVTIATTTDVSSHTAYVILEYTKTTD